MITQLETERLILRRLLPNDSRHYHALESDPKVKEFLGGVTKQTVDHYREAIRLGSFAVQTTLAVTQREDGSFVGRCGFTQKKLVKTDALGDEFDGWEVNIVLAKSCWGKGYGTEIGRRLIPAGFGALGCDIIFGIMDRHNTRSIKLCEKLKMNLRPDIQPSNNATLAFVYVIQDH